MASALATALAASALALNVPSLSRRAVVSGAVAAAAVGCPPAAQADYQLSLPSDGAFKAVLGGFEGNRQRANGQTNQLTGISLIRDCFDGKIPSEGLESWFATYLSDDFEASFAGGAIKVGKGAFIKDVAALVKSYPDFLYTGTGFSYADSPKIVSWTAVVKGTLSGEPYSPLPGVPAVSANSPPVACQNDPEKITAYFKSGAKSIERIVVEAKPGGKGFSGPIGFYLQAGGDPAKLPAL